MALIGSTGGETWPPVTTPQKGPAVETYEVEINGVKTTLKLSDEDARARGLKPAAEAKPATAAKSESKARKPANKARTAANKQSEGDA